VHGCWCSIRWQCAGPCHVTCACQQHRTQCQLSVCIGWRLRQNQVRPSCQTKRQWNRKGWLFPCSYVDQGSTLRGTCKLSQPVRMAIGECSRHSLLYCLKLAITSVLYTRRSLHRFVLWLFSSISFAGSICSQVKPMNAQLDICSGRCCIRGSGPLQCVCVCVCACVSTSVCPTGCLCT